MNINRIKRGNRRLINIIEDGWIMASRVAKFEIHYIKKGKN